MKKKMLLHTCCAPCFTSVFEKLNTDYDITIHWYNPNIFPFEEHGKRLGELLRYSHQVGVRMIIDDDYVLSSRNWDKNMLSVKDYPEGGIRCEKCINFRLAKTALLAKNGQFDIFATTLTVSPHKNATSINQTGQMLSEKYDIPYLVSDFKKDNGYLRSIELSKEHKLYRQKYCGCEVSKRLYESRQIVTK